MPLSWNVAFTVVRNVLIITLLVVSIGTVVYVGRTSVKKLEPALDNINSFFTSPEVSDIRSNLAITAKNTAKLTEETNKALASLNDVMHSDSESDKIEREKLGKNILDLMENLNNLLSRLTSSENTSILKALLKPPKNKQQ